jgi:hypothetical protein
MGENVKKRPRTELVRWAEKETGKKGKGSGMWTGTFGTTLVRFEKRIWFSD